MAKYASKDLVIEFDNASLSLVDMSTYVQEIGGFDVEAVLEESHSFGDSWVEQLFAQMRKVGDITIKGFYDDTATTGPNAIFNDVGNVGSTGGASRTLKLTWGSTKTSSVETFIKNYRRMPTRGELTKYEVVLTPTGAVTEV